MARNSAIPPEALEEILAWLNPDPDVAAAMYVQLRSDLATLFGLRRLPDPEGLTDEVFDRVAKKVQEVRPTYEGDPRHYFRAVANNLVKENLKKIKAHVPLEGIDLPAGEVTDIDEEREDIEECLQLCLQELSAEKRKLIMEYYAKEKQAKIDHRSELAQSLGTSVKTLRVKAHRIRESLEICIERCMKHKAEGR